MTATVTAPVPTAATTTTRSLRSTSSMWRTAAKAGVTAAAATTAIAAVAHAGGVSLETAPGEAIPVLGFGQLTLFFTAVGALIARMVNRRAQQPHRAFVRTTLALTALSFAPDLALDTDVATKVTLMLTHVVAAVIVIPALSRRLPEHAAH